MHWQVLIYDARIGDVSLQLTVDDLIFDTGSSFIYIPKREYQQFYKEITRDHNCDIEESTQMLYCDCLG